MPVQPPRRKKKSRLDKAVTEFRVSMEKMHEITPSKSRRRGVTLPKGGAMKRPARGKR